MAAAACVTTLEQNQDRSWTGRSIRTGEPRKFATLNDYQQYVKSLETQGTYCPNVDPQYTAQTRPGQSTASSGFLEFQARDPVAQSKYSAMSPSWEGIQSSETAIARGDYDLDRAEKNRQDLRAKPVAVTPQPTWNCSIQ